MHSGLKSNPLALAVAAAIGASAALAAPQAAVAAKPPGKYVSGDFHNHTTCSDGSISMQKLVKKATDKTDTPWGLDWFVQAGHGGSGNRNCTLVEDSTLATPAYPVVNSTVAPNPILGPNTVWNSAGSPAVTLKGSPQTSSNMWRWQALQEFQYPLMEYLNYYKDMPLFLGLESVVAGHEHTSMSVITGQIPQQPNGYQPPTTAPYAKLGNADALAQWVYCFDRGNGADVSRGNTSNSSGVGNNWDCTNPASPDSTNPAIGWSTTALKLVQPSGTGTGTAGHLKTVEAVKWMKQFHASTSYYVPAHLERAGPFNPNGNNGFNVEHLRNFNNAAPDVAFGMETQPGHGASDNRGEYAVLRNNFGTTSAPNFVDTVGGTTYGGTGVYGAQIGGVWDALLGEGRRFWFFASSDWHNRGQFSADDRRSTQDFYPGEYQRNYTMVRNATSITKLTPTQIVDGLRTGNNWAASGQIIDRLAFVACASYPGFGFRSNATVESYAVNAATNNTDTDVAGCSTMGEKLVVRPGADIVVAIVVRDPAGTNYAPYTFPNPSLLQVNISRPMNEPVLEHVDVIRGLVSGFRAPGAADYAGEWPRNTNWLRADGTTADLSAVPDAAKNTTATLFRTFNSSSWTPVTAGDGTTYLKMSFRIPAVAASQYVRLRGSNLPPSVPYETDANGNPLSDVYTNASDTTRLRIPCSTVGTNVPTGTTTFTGTNIDGCPNHLAVATSPTTGDPNPIAGQKAVSYDVAAWADLWFYSNPIYVEVAGSQTIAGVR